MPALFDPAAHEPLGSEQWDERAARGACAVIVREALAAYDPVTLWPCHPRDAEPDDPARTRGYTSFYLGAAGTAWALQRVTGSSPLGADTLLEAFDAEPDMPSMRYGLLLGDVGVSLVALELGGDEHADRLEAAIRDAIPRTERELLWAAPGAIHASLAAHDLTGDDRVIKLFGLGLASAVFLDAFVIRLFLVPSLMFLFGRASWWLPASIDRRLPRLSIEGPEHVAPEPGS